MKNRGPPNAIKQKSKRVDLGNSILKYGFLYDALQVIFNKNLKRPRNFGDIGSFGDLSTRRI